MWLLWFFKGKSDSEQDKTVDYISMEYEFRNSKSRLTPEWYNEVWEKYRKGGVNYKDLVEVQYLKENPDKLKEAIESGYVDYSSNPLLKKLKDDFYKDNKNSIQKVQENTENALYEIDEWPPELRPEQEELFEEYVKKNNLSSKEASKLEAALIYDPCSIKKNPDGEIVVKCTKKTKFPKEWAMDWLYTTY